MNNVNFNPLLEKINTLEIEIAKYRHRETELRESEEKYRQLFETSRDALMTLSPPSWKFNSANKAALELFEVASVAEFTALGPWDLSPKQQPDKRPSAEKAQEMIEIAMQEGSNFFEWEHQTFDGKTFAADVLLTRLEFGGQILAQATVRDISERKRSEMLLKQERDFSAKLIENAPVIILVLNEEGKIVRFNHFMETISGYTQNDVKGKDWFSTFLPKEHIEKTKKLFFQTIDDMQTNGHINSILTKDGTEKIIEWYNKRLTDAHNNTIGILSIGLDITRYKQIENELHRSEEHFRTLVESTNDLLWEVDANGRYTYISPQIETMLGYRPQEILGKSPFELMPPEEAQRVGSIFKECVNQRAPIVMLNNINICKNGTQKIFETSGVAFFDKIGNFSGYRGIDRDITRHQLTEQTLHDSEEKFRSITASAQDAIVMMDNDGKISYWNIAAEKIFGHTEKEAIGQMLHTFITPKRFLAAHKIGFSHFKRTGEGPAVGKTLELIGVKKDGTEFPIELSLSANKINGMWNAIGIIRDITERKEMEQELKQKEEMMISQSRQAAMGDMIAMIAHQWRQPITVISMVANNIEVNIELEDEITTEELKRMADVISEQTQHLSKTIDDFRNFFKPNQDKVQTTIGNVMEETLKIIGTSLKNNNIAVTIINNSETELLTYSNQLLQVFLNILGNAKDILLCRMVADAKVTVTINETKDSIVTTICDNGGGIPDNAIKRLGEPYFTTKKNDGTGLGLYMSMTIVAKHLNGSLTWENRDDGACFIVTLPKE
ncbi:PAS domain S-box protein [bacterium]|nr:PAS domain S-box protein [bacterium]MBU1883530.1 PAS domain S-box protein [bacterium]